MIFACDLDRTLIYSKRFIDDKINVERDLVVVEKDNDKIISYMTKNAIKLLKELSEMVTFIPVTTRTIEQYKRIDIFQNEIKPKYVIVSNGGNIIENDKIKLDWNNKVISEFERNCIGYNEVKERFNEIGKGNWVLREYMADELFYYFIIDQEKIPYDKIYDFEIWLKENRWTLSIQGRKLYLIPDCVDKWKAISLISEKVKARKVIAAGDSLLDLKMLNKADYSISPDHGEIKKRVFKDGNHRVTLNFTKRSGFYASEDILTNIRYYLLNQ